MSFADRREARKKTKQLARAAAVDSGATPTPSSAPRREGHRGKKYAFSKDNAPMLIVPRKEPSMTRIPVPPLPGHEDIRSSDSELESASIPAPLGEAPHAGHLAPKYGINETPPSPSGSTEIGSASQTESEGEDKGEVNDSRPIYSSGPVGDKSSMRVPIPESQVNPVVDAQHSTTNEISVLNQAPVPRVAPGPSSKSYESGGSEHPFGLATSHSPADNMPDLPAEEKALLLTGPFPGDTDDYSGTSNGFQFQYNPPSAVGALSFDSGMGLQHPGQLRSNRLTVPAGTEWPANSFSTEPCPTKAPIQLPNLLARSISCNNTPRHPSSTPARHSHLLSGSPTRPRGAIPFVLPPLTPTTRAGSRGPATPTTPITSRSVGLVPHAGTPTALQPRSLTPRAPHHLHNPTATPTHNLATPSRRPTSVLARRPSTGPLPSPASRAITSNQMRSVAPSHGPIRSQTPNRSSRRDTASPYASQQGQMTPQLPLRRVSTPLGVSIPATPSRSTTPGSKDKTPHSAPSLSRNLTLTSLPSVTGPVSPAVNTPISHSSDLLSKPASSSDPPAPAPDAPAPDVPAPDVPAPNAPALMMLTLTAPAPALAVPALSAPALAAAAVRLTAPISDSGVALEAVLSVGSVPVASQHGVAGLLDHDGLDGHAPANSMDVDNTIGWGNTDEDVMLAEPDHIHSLGGWTDSREPSNVPRPSENIANGGEAAGIVQMSLGSISFAAPTAAEYTINVVQENKTIMEARKSRGEPGNKVKGIRSITGYTDQEQAYIFLMRVVMLYFWIARIPWPIDDGIAVEYAKTYVKKYTEIDLTKVVTDEFVKTLCSGTSRLRSEGQNLVLGLVKDFWTLEEQDVAAIEYLQENDRLTYVDRNREPDERFNTELVGNVMAALMFGPTKKIGILFLDKMMEDDDPDELKQVLQVVAKPGLDGKPQILTIVDTSPQASRGPSISAIAFTCIHIYHALERLKAPAGPRERRGRSKAGEFGARELEAHWARYVRELTQRPRLGDIRACLLRRLQKEYIKLRPREGEQPLGSDHMW